MKKLVALFVLLAGFSSSIFALHNEADVSLSLPMSLSSTTGSYASTTYNINQFSKSIGFDLSDTIWVTRKMGAKVNFGFWWWAETQETYYLTAGNAVYLPEPTTINPDKDNKSSAFNAFIGFAYKVVDSSIATITVAPGINFNIDKQECYGTEQELVFTGIGADFVAKVFFAGDFYGVFSCPLVYDIAVSIDGKNWEDFKGRFCFTPKFGIGFRL